MNIFKKLFGKPVRSQIVDPVRKEREDANTLLSAVPADVRGRISLINGALHVSMEIQGNASLLSFVSLAKKQGIQDVIFHDAQDFDREYQHGIAFLQTESAIKQYAVELLQTARNMDVSDIHIVDYGTYGLIQMRRLGMLLDYCQLQGEIARKLICAIYQTMAQSAASQFSPTERQDGRIAKREYLPADVHSVRIHTEPLECAGAKGGTGTFMVLRLLYDRTQATGTLSQRLEVLGYTNQDAEKFKFLSRRTGLTIIAGPTGHGKSTLLKHVMEAMAFECPEKSYMSVEDPPEYPMQKVKQILVNTNVAAADNHLRGESYTNAIAGAMRSDPDVIMIGEIRYPEAAAAAINAALTGHAVWATLHANNALGIIKRMMSLLEAAKVHDPMEYLCDHNVLAGLIYQRLIPVLCPDCKIPYTDVVNVQDSTYWDHGLRFLPRGVLRRLHAAVQANKCQHVAIRGFGCPKCNNLGIIGQTVVSEIIPTDQHILAALRKNDFTLARTLWLTGRDGKQRGRTYVGNAIELISSGVADPLLTEVRLGVPLHFDKTDEELYGSQGDEDFYQKEIYGGRPDVA